LGQFVCGQLAGQPVFAMQGRFHLYEGYADHQVYLPLALMREMGVSTLFISNAAGGLNPRFQSGELMVLESHLDLMFRSWQIPVTTKTEPTALAAGSARDINNPEEPEASAYGSEKMNSSSDCDQSMGRGNTKADVYDRELIDESLKFARQSDFVLQRGVYAGLLGPNYETRAEYRFLRRIGADVVGMSTVPEVVFAARLGMRVLAFSIVANVAKPDVLERTSGQEIVDAAAVAAPRLRALVENAIAKVTASKRHLAG
jgi:purine-nucleoside phosphorylase